MTRSVDAGQGGAADTLRCTILGCATSVGVPIVGCPCPVCQSDDPRNKRKRVSIYVQVGTRHGSQFTSQSSLLVDTSPDLRAQLLENSILAVDAVLYTHTHADHIFGLDDLRPIHFFYRKHIDVFGRKDHIQTLQNIFPYAFGGVDSLGPVPVLVPHEVVAQETFAVAGFACQALEVEHGHDKILAYRLGPLAYLTDCSGVSAATKEALTGVHTLVIGALKYQPHAKHFNVQQALDLAEELGVARCVLTHMGHELSYSELKHNLPAWAEPAYDGLVLECPIR